MIQFDNVSMRYKKDAVVLHNITFSVNRGEFVFLVGSSGAGKSTVLSLLHRALVPTSGKIKVAGFELQSLRDSQVPKYRRHVGVVFQDFKLLPKRTVAQNIAIALHVAGVKRSMVKRNVDRVLEWTNLTHRKNALPEDISGGEQQRAAIARAIVNDPPIILADEPTGNLDPHLAIDIMNLFERFNRRGATVVIATHDISLAEYLNKRIIKFEQGKIVED
ncbi:TPA: cell division ATP-binding protein FtsE [bacterium]|nr:cell division ATP-binding protein FtsE [bacterium]